MAWTQTDLDALSAAITSGIKRVTYADGRHVEYQTTADMLALRREMRLEVTWAESKIQPGPRTTIGRVLRR
uniref:phage head-tail joining protein n=1 Tax=uncultured Sphingomonas sp. TaxID=158754 RepID=UPI0035CB1022